MLRLGTGSRGNPNSLLAAPMLRVLRACRVGARACGQERSTWPCKMSSLDLRPLRACCPPHTFPTDPQRVNPLGFNPLGS